jgi:AcrR family transcriptional regulator
MPIDTKERLLDAAERLFAQRGFSATSLRDITAEAQANLASVNYHFGGKEPLLDAVFERRLVPVNAERLALLDEYEADAGDKPVRLQKLLWAFLAPPFRHMHEAGEAGRHFMQLVGRVHGAPGGATREFVSRFDSVRERFRSAFARTLPHLDEEEVERRMHYVIGCMAHTFCWCEAICCLQSVQEPERDMVLRSIIQFSASGLAAPAIGVVEPAEELALMEEA